MRYIPYGHTRGPSLGYAGHAKPACARRRPRMAARVAAWLVPLLLTHCAAVERQRMCETEAGPQPYPLAGGFGVIGIIVAESSPEKRVWRRKVDACLARARLDTAER